MAFFENIKTAFKLKSSQKDAVFALYNALVDEARTPALYKDYDIPDTLDGRFDSIVYHIVLFGLGTSETVKADEGLKDLGQDLISIFLKDMDRNLREIGVGDLSVGKKVKKMASALYGRIDAYSTAMVQDNPKKALADALKKNLYRGEKVSKAKAEGLADYGLKHFARYQGLTLAQIKKGRVA